AHAADVIAAAEWVAAFVRQAGGTAELVPWGERPLVVGDLPASNGADDAPTVLLYGHFDVQPPAPLDQWESDPFELSVRGEWAYGRGIADDKGQLYALLKAGQELAREARLPVNLRIACDGEEEVGGHSVVEYLEGDEPPGAEERADQGARPADPSAAEEFYLRVFAEPALDVNGIESGSPHLQKTVLPVVAEANLSIRLAPLQEPDAIAGELERLLREAAPEGAEPEIERLSSAPPGLVSPHTNAVQLGLEAFERALGTRPLLVRSGGTLPIVPALAAK